MRKLHYPSALALLLVTSGLFATGRLAVAAPQTASLHLGTQCLCTQCGFDAQRAMSKLSGVQRVTLTVKERRMEIHYDDAKQSASSLMQALAKTELGKDSAFMLSLDNGTDPSTAAKALAQIAGIKTIKADAKTHSLFVTFSATSSVTASQLETALKGQSNHA